MSLPSVVTVCVFPPLFFGWWIVFLGGLNASGSDRRDFTQLVFTGMCPSPGRQFNSFGAHNSVIFNKEDQGRAVKNLCLRCSFLKVERMSCISVYQEEVFVSVAAEHKSLQNALNQGGHLSSTWPWAATGRNLIKADEGQQPTLSHVDQSQAGQCESPPTVSMLF